MIYRRTFRKYLFYLWLGYNGRGKRGILMKVSLPRIGDLINVEQNFKNQKNSQGNSLGLVVYGGIALAIYMNGICREFYNAVRGRGIYKLIKALTDSDIIVDIISGTSAGGINGVLLAMLDKQH
jgi:hypothetical protein